jgi:hypothetical protein
MDSSGVLLGVLYVILGLAFMFTRSRFVGRSRGLALVWLFMGVLLTANGALKIVQATA